MTKNNKLSPRFILAAFIVFNLILGLFIVGDYGISTDENAEGRRSELAYTIISGTLDFNPALAYENLGTIQYYGTAATVIGHTAMKALSAVTNISGFAARHYIYFVFFQIGLAAFYFLATNFMTEWAALLTTILFGTQPIFFGHSFINPKDIPLMSLFLATVSAGFYMVDHLSNFDPTTTPQNDENTKKQRDILILLGVAIALQFLKNLLPQAAAAFITYAYQAPETSLANRIFEIFAAGGSLEGYLILGEHAAYNSYSKIVLLLLLALLYAGYQIWRHKLFGKWINLPVILAGAIWGFAISTRVVALAAGGIVGLYGLIVLQKKGLRYLVSYTLTATTVGYVCWPYLWLFGFRGFLDALLKFSDFSWRNQVLFEGQLYNYNEVPARYLPKLMLLQITEPAIILIVTGFIVSLYLLYKKKISPLKISLLYAWFSLPLLYTILADTITYNNFRQYFFILPPLFILAGLALNEGLERIQNKIWGILAGVLLLAPAILALVQLHPYQYIYYNQFTGGMAGAYHQYELDYWYTSSKELMAYIDENITPGSRILVFGNESRLTIYAENEYKFVSYNNIRQENYEVYEYAVIPTTDLKDLQYLQDELTVYQVERNGAVLAIVKKIID